MFPYEPLEQKFPTNSSIKNFYEATECCKTICKIGVQMCM